jgi:hypothetical protein
VSPKIVFFALLCAVSCLASAQSINLSFADDGDRQIWIAPSLPTQAPGDSDGIRTGKSEANLPIHSEKDSETVFVWDRKSGNLASKSVRDAKSAIWVVKPEDFKSIAQVSVHIEHDEHPVAAANVDLEDGSRKQSQLLDSSCLGTVTFFGVKPGSITITVRYKVAGKDAPPVKQILEAGLERTVPIPSEEIALVEKVETVGKPANVGMPTDAVPPQTTESTSAGTAKPDSSKTAPSKEGGSFFGSLIVYLLALGAMAAAIYYAVLYVKKNPDSVGSKLEQLGVQIPKPGDDPLTNPSQIPPAAKPTPAPVQKIILDDAAPGPITPLASAPATPGAIVDPRLVSQSGDSMPIPEGDFMVGREIGLGLSLVGETTVSRKHANITRNGSQVVVKDFGSTNGTFVNGVQVHGERQLQSGDTVQFGSVRFRFEG